MASAAGLRPNHYEVLGVPPTASDAEIARAFARMMGMFSARPVAAAAHISIAFEVLRNPGKRLDYDRSLGIMHEPEPLPRSLGFAVRSSPGLIGSAWSGFGEQVTGTPASEPAREPVLPAAPEAEVAALIAASLREERVRPAPARPARSARPDDERPFDWRRPALAVGALILAAGSIGTMAGLSVRDAEDGAPAADITAASAAPKTVAQLPVASDSPARAIAAPGVEPASHAKAPPARKPAPPAASFAEKAVDQAESIAVSADSEAPVEQASDETAADPLAPKAVPATMPLPNSVIARTIERIGYSCGTVVSTASSAAGTYTVTCSSGQTYKAKSVHGRYRFRRSG